VYQKGDSSMFKTVVAAVTLQLMRSLKFSIKFNLAGFEEQKEPYLQADLEGIFEAHLKPC